MVKNYDLLQISPGKKVVYRNTRSLRVRMIIMTIICLCKKDAPTTVQIHVKCHVGQSVKERDPIRTTNKCGNWKKGYNGKKAINMEEADMKAGK